MIIIERGDSVQTETNAASGDAVQSKIKWINDCTYELFDLKQTVFHADTIHPYLRTHTIKTKILKIAKDYCVFESSVEGVEMTYVDTLRPYKK